MVIENFSKSEDNIKDKMGISLCAFNPITTELQWVGANNPPFVTSNSLLHQG